VTVKQAFEIAVKNGTVTIGDNSFVTLCWVNPDKGDPGLPRPFLVTLHGNVAIEVDRFGRFVTAYSVKCDGYFPFPYLEKKLPEVTNEQFDNA
jgi:hypothetical protein